MAKDTITATAPTSTATSAVTEPEVVAGISSGEPRDVAPTPDRSGRFGLLTLLAGGMVLGLATSLWLHRTA